MKQSMRAQNKRIENLLSYAILDTLPEQDYDAITRIAAEICRTSISLISFVDDHRQWFKSRRGLEVAETNRDIAFCAYAIKTPEAPLIVPDARKDERFANNPLVIGEPGIVFYAGFPLNSAEGYALGTLCVIDKQPKQLSDSQIDSLVALSVQVTRLLDLRKKKQLLEEKSMALEAANIELTQFAKLVAHDIKGPLANINMATNSLLEDFKKGVNTNSLNYMNMISRSSIRLCGLIDSLLLYYTSDAIDKNQRTTLSLAKLLQHLKETLCLDSNTSITLISKKDDVYVNDCVLKQILLNLLTNSIKYNNSDNIEVSISVAPHKDGGTQFCVKDNGIGIEPQHIKSIFSIFTTHALRDRFGNQGTGIGLAAVKKLVESQGGFLRMRSVVGEGSEFTFSLM